MALGDLVVRLAADVAAFQSDMGKAVHLAQRTQQQISNAFARVRDVAGIALTGFTVAEIIKKTTEAERTLARLSAVLVSTGRAAGLTAEGVNDLAESLKKSSTFDDGDIKNGLIALLRFRDVQGQVFRDGARLALDLAAATGGALPEAFQKVGRALSDPEKGLKALRSEGVRLSESQEELAKRFQRTGDIASAQKIVLQEMQKAFGGTAAAENQGLYGAVKRTESAWDDLLKTIGKTKEFQSTANGGLGLLERGLKNIESVIASGKLGDILKAISSPLPVAGIAGLAFAEKPPGGPVTGKIGGAASEEALAKVGALQRQIERAQEKAKKDREFAQQEQLAFGQQLLQHTLESEREILSQREKLLEQFNSQNLVSIKDYYDARRFVVTSALAAESTAIQKQLEAEAANLASLKGKGDIEQANQSQIRLNKLIDDRRLLQQKAGGELVLLSAQEQNSVKKLRDEISDLNAEILELQGRTAEAASARLTLQNRDRRERFTANGNQDGLRLLDTQERLAAAQASFNAARDEQDRIVSRLQISEDRLQNSLRVGAISEIDALKQTGDARRAAAAQLDGIVANLERVAQASQNPALILQAEQARASLERLRSESELLAEKFDTIFKDSFSDAFSDFISGAKNAKDAFKSFADSVTQQINRIVSQAIATDISKALGITGGGSGGGAGGIGGFFSMLFGGAGGGSSFMNFGGGSVPLEWSGAGFETGTDYVPRTGLAMLHKGEAVIPASENMRGGGGAPMTVIIQTPDVGSFRSSEGQVTAQMARMMDRANKRNR